MPPEVHVTEEFVVESSCHETGDLGPNLVGRKRLETIARYTQLGSNDEAPVLRRGSDEPKSHRQVIPVTAAFTGAAVLRLPDNRSRRCVGVERLVCDLSGLS